MTDLEKIHAMQLADISYLQCRRRIIAIIYKELQQNQPTNKKDTQAIRKMDMGMNRQVTEGQTQWPDKYIKRSYEFKSGQGNAN